MPCHKLKIAVFAPIPNASDNTATMVNVGRASMIRSAYRRSCRMTCACSLGATRHASPTARPHNAR